MLWDGSFRRGPAAENTDAEWTSFRYQKDVWHDVVSANRRCLTFLISMSSAEPVGMVCELSSELCTGSIRIIVRYREGMRERPRSVEELSVRKAAVLHAGILCLQASQRYGSEPLFLRKSTSGTTGTDACFLPCRPKLHGSSRFTKITPQECPHVLRLRQHRTIGNRG